MDIKKSPIWNFFNCLNILEIAQVFLILLKKGKMNLYDIRNSKKFSDESLKSLFLNKEVLDIFQFNKNIVFDENKFVVANRFAQDFLNKD